VSDTKRKDAIGRAISAGSVADARDGHEHRALSKNARCLAAAAGVDILNGEPIAGLKALNRAILAMWRADRRTDPADTGTRAPSGSGAEDG